MNIPTTSPASSLPTTLCLHHNDADGRACAAIVRRALGACVDLYEMNYGNPIPWDEIDRADHVILVDFSLPRLEMEQIAQSRQLTWIDHHISALNEMALISDGWAGLRDTDEAACVLTWRYFFPQGPIPRAVTLIGDRDTWRNAEPDSKPFAEGLYQCNTRPDNDTLWRPLLDNDLNSVQELVDQGEELLTARLRKMRRFVTRFSFPVTFEGHRTLVVNQRGDGDLGEFMRRLGYDIAYCYIEGPQNGKLMTFVTLFSEQVDVSEIASKFGGGGHRGAAGFSFERGSNPFPPGAHVEWENKSQRIRD